MNTLEIKRSITRTFLPRSIYERIRAEHSRQHQIKLLQQVGIADSTKRFIERYGSVVRYGPFAGMTYPIEAALNRHSIPKLLGTYECEVLPVIQKALSRSYDCIIDIGSAEGYYSVGLAMRTGLPVYAYDPEPIERKLCSLMAQLNNVDHIVHLFKYFQPEDIKKFEGKRAFVICDCEGFESQLFNPDTVLQTKKWDILIELHGPTQGSLPALSWPHATQVISAQPRLDRAFEELNDIGSTEELLCEFRNEGQKWLCCDTSRTSDNLYAN